MSTWLAVIGYEGLYEVSDQGDVRSLPRLGTRGGVLKPETHELGYPSVRLSKNGRKTHYTVHSLVLRAFVGPRPEDMECRHLNGVCTDNRLTNLAWGTSRENSDDIRRHGTNAESRVTECPSKHPYDEKNTRIYRGRRYCRECMKIRTRDRMRRIRAAQKVAA